MRSSPCLDFDALIAPLAPDRPAGIPVPFDIRHQLEESRKQNDANNPKACWPALVHLAQETLTRTSKDLVVAARLTEGLVKLHGFAGLRDGLHLLNLLVEECWDRLYPVLDDGDLEVRAAPFNWLDDPDRGACFPTTLRSVPFLGADGNRYSWLDWQRTHDSSGLILRDAVDHVLRATPVAILRRNGDDLAASMEELDRLCLSLCMRLGSVAPSLIHLRLAVKDCYGLIQQLIDQKGPAAPDDDLEPEPSLPDLDLADDDQDEPEAFGHLDPKWHKDFRNLDVFPAEFSPDRRDTRIDYGPLQDLARNWKIDSILVNGPSQVFQEQSGRRHLTDVRFRDADHLRQLIDQLAFQAGRRVDSPMIDLRLSDGARVYAVLPPLAPDGPILTIEFFGQCITTMDEWLEAGTLAPDMALFLKAAVEGRLNILVCGGPGSGKTTLLSLLGVLIPAGDRVLTIEDHLKLELHRKHWVRLQTAPAARRDAPLTPRDLVRQALAMRPDRILLDECRGDEAFDVLHFMRTSGGGSMTAMQAHTPAEARSLLETLLATTHPTMPPKVIRWHIVNGVDLIVQVNRFMAEIRKVTHITEILGATDEGIRMADLFRYNHFRTDDEGVQGQFEATGFRSNFVPHLEAHGIQLPANFFEKRVLVCD
jgi:pilus assembly protein CpaF